MNSVPITKSGLLPPYIMPTTSNIMYGRLIHFLYLCGLISHITYVACYNRYTEFRAHRYTE